MKARMTLSAMAMTAAVLIAALVSPMVAAAAPVPRLGGPAREGGAAASSNAKSQPLENLKKRIANVLHARKARFDAVLANLNLRLDRIDGIADRVEKAGGDVSAARTSIEAAEAHIAKAKELEQDAVEAFEAIPSASNKREAFREARAKARLAHDEIKACREDIRAAARALREEIKKLKAEADDQ